MRGFTSCIVVPLLSAFLFGSSSFARGSLTACSDVAAFDVPRSMSHCAASSGARLHCESLLVRIESDWTEEDEAFEESSGYEVASANGSSRFVPSSHEKLVDLTNYVRACQQP